MVVVKVVVTAIAALEMSGNTQNISNLAYSSVGRAAVSKTACRGFKSYCPCQQKSLFCLPDRRDFFNDAFLAERDARCVRDAASPVMHAFGACKNASHHLSQRSGITYYLFAKRFIL